MAMSLGEPLPLVLVIADTPRSGTRRAGDRARSKPRQPAGQLFARKPR